MRFEPFSHLLDFFNAIQGKFHGCFGIKTTLIIRVSSFNIVCRYFKQKVLLRIGKPKTGISGNFQKIMYVGDLNINVFSHKMPLTPFPERDAR